MKAYKVELLVIDFDGLGAEGIKNAIEDARYPNHCMCPAVQSVDVREIGDWSDNHPLNQRGTAAAEYRRLFDT